MEVRRTALVIETNAQKEQPTAAGQLSMTRGEDVSTTTTDGQVRIEQVPDLVARTINIKHQRVLVVHRNLATDKSSEIYRPVREFLDSHPHEVMVGPEVGPEPTWDWQMGEVTFYRLTERG